MTETLLIGIITDITLMAVVWLIYLKVRLANVVDVYWGLGVVFLSWLYVILNQAFSMRHLLIVGLVSLWGLRLSYYILKRMIHEPTEDPRYTEITKNWTSHHDLRTLLIFEYQAVFQLIITVPILIIAHDPQTTIGLWEWIGVAIWILGYVGEMIADQQLKNFKASPENKGKVCDAGLWNYSRHPNYFFECVIWVGVFVYALGSPYGIWGIVSPFMIIFLILKVTGIPISEKLSLRSRGEAYRRYQATTSAFIPLPKRKAV